MTQIVTRILKCLLAVGTLLMLCGCSVSLDDLINDDKQSIIVQALLKNFKADGANGLPAFSNEGLINPQLWKADSTLLTGNVSQLNSDLDVYPVEFAAQTQGEALELKIPYNQKLLTILIGVPPVNSPVYLGEFDMRWMTLANRVLANTTRYSQVKNMGSVQVLTILGHIYNKIVFIREDKGSFVKDFDKLEILADGTWSIADKEYPESSKHPSRLPDPWESTLFSQMSDLGIQLPSSQSGSLDSNTILDKNLISTVSLSSLSILENLLLPNQNQVSTFHVNLPNKQTNAKITFLRDLSLQELDDLGSMKVIRTNSQGVKSEFLLRQLNLEVLASKQIQFTVPRDGGLEHFEFSQDFAQELHVSFYFSIETV